MLDLLLSLLEGSSLCTITKRNLTSGFSQIRCFGYYIKKSKVLLVYVKMQTFYAAVQGKLLFIYQFFGMVYLPSVCENE